MKYAEHLADIPNAFKLGPLEPEELERFFCNETMEFRTGDKYDSPIRDIYEDCQFPSDNNAFLLLGHRGCGKSTELNKMSQELEKNGYQVVTVRCNLDLDLINPVYTDLLILIGEALLKIAEKVGCTLDRDIKK
jgi:predicted AAA+ superfamily ATPase